MSRYEWKVVEVKCAQKAVKNALPQSQVKTAINDVQPFLIAYLFLYLAPFTALALTLSALNYGTGAFTHCTCVDV